MGGLGSECNVSEIVSESEECRDAATHLGRIYVGVIIEHDSRPSGCYYWESTPGAYNKNVYLNPYSRSDTHNINRMTGGVCKKGISDIYKYALYKQTIYSHNYPSANCVTN